MSRLSPDLFIHYIYFLGHDFNKPSPEELVAINFMEGLLKRQLKANGLKAGRIGPQPLVGIHLPQTHFTSRSSFTGQKKQEEQEERSLIIRQDGGFQPLLRLNPAMFWSLWAVRWTPRTETMSKKRDMEGFRKRIHRGGMNCMGVRWLSDVPHLIRVSSHPCHGKVPSYSLGKFHTFQSTYCPSLI